MAIVKGKDDLLRILREAKRREDIKGLQAEIDVCNILESCLLADTYVIVQPQIGSYESDFLIISPKYGFRLVEVKNFGIRYGDTVNSNGLLQTPYGNKNPLEQVRLHAAAFKNYLVSNYSVFEKNDLIEA